MPSASGIPDRTPSAASIASCSPVITLGSKPSARTALRKSGPFEASRTAAVARMRGERTSIWSISRRKRRKAISARPCASFDSRPVSPSPWPRPASTFSLKMIDGIRGAPENTTRRIEFEPMSTIAIGSRFSMARASLPDSLAAPEAQFGHRPLALQCGAATGERGVGHEIMMEVESLALFGSDPLVAAIGLQAPALLGVEQIGDHHLVEHLGVDGRVLDRQHIFDAAVEIARHPVGRADVDPGIAVGQLVAVSEAPDSGMLEEAAD